MRANPKIYQILADTTRVYRKGAEVEERQLANGTTVLELVGFPPIPDKIGDPDLDNRVLIDCHFLVVAVSIDKAEAVRDEIAIMAMGERDLFRNGPSYVDLGAWLEDQATAFQFMALGEALGFWTVLTPLKLGFPPEIRDHAAGMGYVLITPFPKIPDETTEISHMRTSAVAGIETLCPYCERAHDLQMTAAGQDTMDDGDVAICVLCGEPSIFDSKLAGKLRKPDGMERENLLANPDVMASLATWSDLMRRSNAIPD